MFSGGSLLPYPPSSLPVPGLKTFNSAELKVTGMGSKYSESVSLGVMMGRANSTSTPWFLDLGILDTLQHILARGSLHIQSPRGQDST